LTDLTRFGDDLVVAVGVDWFELAIIRGQITVPNHGLGVAGNLLLQDWRVNGATTTDEPTAVGSRRRIMGRIIDANTIDYSPEYSFREVV
jgi:hypothetical protein